MLLKGIAVISIAAAAAAGVYMQKIYLIPAFFIICFAGLFMIWALSCITCTLFVDTDKDCEKQSLVFRFYANCIIDSLLQILRIRLHIRGLEMLPEDKFLIAGNHRSSFDPIIEMGVMRRYNAGFIAKKELFEIPVIGKIMHKCFCLSLDRGNARSDMMSIIKAINIIKSQTASIGVYPEGTRNRGEKLLPFKNGAFKIAKKAECPIVVLRITNSELIMKNAPFKKTDVYLEVAGVLSADYTASSTTAEIGERVRELLENNNLETKLK